MVTTLTDRVHTTSSHIGVISFYIAGGTLIMLAAGSSGMFLTIAIADIMTASH